MRIYFIAANFWAFIGLVLVIGKRVDRTAPVFYSFMGIGGSFSPIGYCWLIAMPLVMAIVFFSLYVRSRKNIS